MALFIAQPLLVCQAAVVAILPVIHPWILAGLKGAGCFPEVTLQWPGKDALCPSGVRVPHSMWLASGGLHGPMQLDCCWHCLVILLDALFK